MRRGERFFFAALVVVLLGACLVAVLIGIGDQRMKAARAKIDRPSAKPADSPRLDQVASEGKSNLIERDSRTYPDLLAAAHTVSQHPEWEDASDLLYFERFPWRERSDAERAKMKNLIASIQGLLTQTRAAAADDALVPELDLSAGYATLLPHLAEVRRLARMLGLDALVASDAGDAERVVDDIVAIMQLAAALEDEPVVISQLVRAAISDIAVNALEGALTATRLSTEQSARLVDILSTSDARDAFAMTYGGEADAVALMFQDSDTYDWPNPQRQFIARLYAGPLGRPFAVYDEVLLTEYLADLQRLARLPYYEARPKLDALRQAFEETSPLRMFTNEVLPHLIGALEAQARHEAVLDLAQLGLAIEAYRAETDIYPESLALVAGRIPGGMPVDPFSGEPYVYHAAPGGFILYSVSGNGIDDGGRQGQNTREGDIVRRGHAEKSGGAKTIQVAQS